MQVRVLGSAAGGGFPQWNCNCVNCAGVRSGSLNARPRTQSSIAVSANGQDWLLVNASPDIRQQLNAFPDLRPSGQRRGTRLRAVLLVDSQLDHTAGLLILRESDVPLEVYCTQAVRQDLTTGFPVLSILSHYCGVNWKPLPIDASPFTIPGIELTFRAIPLRSKAPPYSPHRDAPDPGDNIGLLVEDGASRRLFYAPGLGELDGAVLDAMGQAHCLLVDGTMWTDDEMSRRGVGTRLASQMGHLALSGPNGMVASTRRFAAARRILIHINNTNPILDEDSPERASLVREGIEVAYDGMQFNV